MTSPWEFMGPTNVFGRMLCVAVNPKNPGCIYAGSAGSGLWRSYTAGRGGDWHQVSTGFPVMSVSAIAIDTADTNSIYIGTGEMYLYGGAESNAAALGTRGTYGIGVLKTTNGGATWTKSLDWSTSQQRTVQVIKFNPLNSNTVFAGTSEGLYRSTNAGGSWQLVVDALMAQDIVINTADTTFIMASFGNFRTPGWGTYLSLDGGFEWFRMDGFPEYIGKTVFASYPKDPYTVYASVGDTGLAGRVWKTTNFGVTWDSIITNPHFGGMGWYSHFVAVNPNDPNNILNGALEFVGTTNGGQSLFMGYGAHNNYHGYAQDPTDDQLIYVATDGGIFASTNFGNSFENVSAGLRTAQVYSGFSNSASDPNFAMAQIEGNSGWKYTGSTVWESDGTNEAGWTAIDPANDNIVYRAMQWGISVQKSTNRGLAYNSIYYFLQMGMTFGIGCWNTPFLVSNSNTGTLFFGRDRIHKSDDASMSWSSPINTLDGGNPAITMAMSSTSPDTVYVATAPFITVPHVFRTINGGGSWQNITGSLPNRFLLDLAVDPSNSGIVYIAVGGFGTGHIFKSTDAGINWNDITGTLPDLHTSAIAIDPLNTNYIYVGNDIGVYASTDGGTTWNSFNDGMPGAYIVNDLIISPSNRKLRVATYSHGAYQRDLLSPASATVEVGLKGNWNLISVPVEALENDIADLFPTAIAGTVYEYDGFYKQATTLTPGKAYWAKFPVGSTTQSVTGPSMPVVTVNLKKGWNLVGAIGQATTAPTGGIIASSWYEFTATGYQTATTLTPGRGYWVKASDAGMITIGSTE